VYMYVFKYSYVKFKKAGELTIFVGKKILVNFFH
jgi:hypothetical protein